jgi:hypothetical protein
MSQLHSLMPKRLRAATELKHGDGFMIETNNLFEPVVVKEKLQEKKRDYDFLRRRMTQSVFLMAPDLIVAPTVKISASLIEVRESRIRLKKKLQNRPTSVQSYFKKIIAKP